MELRPLHAFGCLASALLLSCGAFFGHHTENASASGAPNAAVTGIKTFSDSDVVMGVAEANHNVYVATLRGVLRFPSAGGDPARLSSAQGLPDDRVFAIAATTDGAVWVATANGVARLVNDRFEAVGLGQPDVGRATALLALENGAVLLGGAQGIAKYDGTHWVRITERYQVMGFARDEHRVLVATAQTGVVALNAELTGADELGESAGIPDTLVRSVVSVGNGRFWALVQGVGGARLAYYDGHKYYGYTHPTERAKWVTLVPQPSNGVALVTETGIDVIGSSGERLVPTEASSADGRQHQDLHARPVDAETSPPATAAPARRSRASRASATAPAQSANAGETAAPEPPPPRPRNVPAFGPPIDVPPSDAHPVDAPRFSLAHLSVHIPGAMAAAFGDANTQYIARAGMGVTRVSNGSTTDFRVGDLVVQHRALSVATDTNNNVWIVTDDGGAARYDGSRFVRMRIDDDANVVPLMFWSHGTVAAAIARTNSTTLAAYRFADNGWQLVTSRRVNLGGPGTVDVRFLAVDERGRFWAGLRAVSQGTTHERGVALIDGNLPRVVQFNSHSGGRRGGRTPPVRVPDDVSAIEFDSGGTAWFASVTGAVSITPPEPHAAAVVHIYGEAQGLRGDVVNDLARGPQNNLYFSTAEGLGYWDGSQFNFTLPGADQAGAAVALAGDLNGTLWGAGPHGVWSYDGHRSHTLEHADGLPEHPVLDIAIDGQNRIWMATEDGITIVERPHTSTIQGTSDSSDTNNNSGSTEGE